MYNRLAGYTNGSKKETYTYDAEGVRRSKTNDEGSLIFISDTTGGLSQTLAETDAEGNLIAAYTRADMLISQIRDGETSYYLYDGHGDVRALSDDKGNITDRYRYNAYGELLEKEGATENHYLYTGEYYDGVSSLYYLRARYMNPSTGTFISMDTYEGSIYDPDSLHKYLYANGNPVTYSDPSGNMPSMIEGIISEGIQSVLNGRIQILYHGLISGLINSITTSVLGGSFKEAMASFATGFIYGAGLAAIRYFVVGAKLVTLARFYVLSASANFIFSTTLMIFAITQDIPELAIMSGVMVVLSIAEWGWAYDRYVTLDVWGNKGNARIEIDPSRSGGGNTSKYSEQLENVSENRTNHIINGSKNSNHGWEKLVPDKNWNDIKNIILEVMDTGVEGEYKSVFSKKAVINGFEVEVTYTKLSDGTIKISDAWINH